MSETKSFSSITSGGKKITVTNEDSYAHYAKPTFRRTVTYTVEAILDGVSGAWNQPEDLANWICENSYVRTVSYVEADLSAEVQNT